ncbi:MAG: M14 family metallopeptidase [Candidatus Zixiibacteriota bacterium]
MSRVTIAVLLPLLICLLILPTVQAADSYAYKTPEQIQQALRDLVGAHKGSAQIQSLAVTPGQRDLSLLMLGNKNGDKPAIFVIANPEADYPIASEAALVLAQKLVGDWKDKLDSYRWYILPCANPDGYANFFSKPAVNNFGNGKSVNNDNDDAFDEDGPDDVNGDGLITMMRQKHPEGEWIPVPDNPVLMKRADAEKGEVGQYRLIPEGFDNDSDGEINEDGPGGVNIGCNFPHRFQHYQPENGLWAASEAESQGILRFAFDHPEIAMIIVLGRNNTIREVPSSDNRSEAMKDKYRLPGWMARNLGIDPEQEFPMKELIEMGREFTGNPNLDEDMIMRFLGAGAAVNPDKDDLSYWTEITEQYKKFIEDAELPDKRLANPGFSSGSIAEWAYYQYGVPTFCMDFWTLPEVEKKPEEPADSTILTPEKLEKMSNDEFLALGEEKIAKFMKDNDVPSHFTPQMVMQGVKGGMMTTEKMAKMIRDGKKKKEGGGADPTEEALYSFNPDAFVSWQKYNHPTLGEVEVGGMKPYSTVLPPADKVDELISKQLPFVLTLADKLPQLDIAKVEVEKKSSGVYKIDAWIVNNGFLPNPTHQGKRCMRPVPVVATLQGDNLEFLEGKERVPIRLLEGSGGTEKVTWLIGGKDGASVSLQLAGPTFGNVVRSIALKGGTK